MPAVAGKIALPVVRFLSESVDDADTLNDLDIILTEACANVCRHAYGGQPGDLEVRLRLEIGHWVELEIVDWGKGFGPEARFENPGPESEGGRGLYIMCTLASSCQLSRQDGENVVFIHKDIGQSRWKS